MIVNLVIAMLAAALSCGSSRSITSNSNSVEDNLKRMQTESNVSSDLTITYDDMHGLWGGTTIVISGKGSGERRERTRGNTEPEVINKSVTKEQIIELVKLLVEQEAWAQKTPDREPVPDESRSRLSISIAGESSDIWEWFNDMKKNQRLIKIKERMRQMTS